MCGRACPAGESCAGGTCSPDPSFRIATMSSMGCTLSADVQSAPMPAGDQRGLLVATNNNVYYTGDTSTVVLPAADLSSITATGTVLDTLVADLRGSAAYVMLDAMGMSPASGTSASIVSLGQLTATGSLSAARVTLSRAIRLDSAGFNNGFYSGFGRIVLYISGGADLGWWQIAMPSGVVTRLTGMMAPTGAASCESWAHSGVAEFFGGEQYVVFMRSSIGVVRQRVRDGMQTTLMANASTGDVCTVGFSIARNRWYFQFEASPAWAPPPMGTFGEHVGTCLATWETP
jgi:hypothetical protein